MFLDSPVALKAQALPGTCAKDESSHPFSSIDCALHVDRIVLPSPFQLSKYRNLQPFWIYSTLHSH